LTGTFGLGDEGLSGHGERIKNEREQDEHRHDDLMRGKCGVGLARHEGGGSGEHSQNPRDSEQQVTPSSKEGSRLAEAKPFAEKSADPPPLKSEKRDRGPHCAITVDHADPATERSRANTKNHSMTAFAMFEARRIHSGVR
jgi:hypothetical protein